MSPKLEAVVEAEKLLVMAVNSLRGATGPADLRRAARLAEQVSFTIRLEVDAMAPGLPGATNLAQALADRAERSDPPEALPAHVVSVGAEPPISTQQRDKVAEVIFRCPALSRSVSIGTCVDQLLAEAEPTCGHHCTMGTHNSMLLGTAEVARRAVLLGEALTFPREDVA